MASPSGTYLYGYLHNSNAKRRWYATANVKLNTIQSTSSHVSAINDVMNGGDVPEVSSVKHEISPKSTNHGSPPDFMKFIKADQAPGPQLIFLVTREEIGSSGIKFSRSSSRLTSSVDRITGC